MKILLSGDFFYNYSHLASDYNKIMSELKDYNKVFINYEGSFRGSEQRKKSVSLAMSNHSIDFSENISLILCNKACEFR